MRVSSSFSVLATFVGMALADDLVTGEFGNATVIEDNPVGRQAVAKLPVEPFWTTGSLDGNVVGSLSVKSSANGIGIDYTVSFSNLPKEGGPFPFHIHSSAVPEDGNCTLTEAHLDPTNRTEAPTCNKAFPQTCQVGDLSGKYGFITRDPYEATFHDEFGSMNVGSNASIPDRSFVIHFSNKTRITCANFVTATTGTNSSTHPSNTTASPPIVTAASSVLSTAPLLQALVVIPIAFALFMI